MTRVVSTLKSMNRMNVMKRSFSTFRSSGYMHTGTPVKQADVRILVTGASGQIGSELIPELRSRYGQENVVASDVKMIRRNAELDPFVYCDVTQYDDLARIAIEFGCTHIVHLASLLSAVGEKNPGLAKKVNVLGTQHVLDICRDNDIKCYIPSSIAVFGPTTPPIQTPDLTVLRPTTIYGITKVYTELLGEYYHQRWGVDFRSLRYPGIISSKVAPGGGTTDYAVEIYHEALLNGRYTSFLHEDQALPMMYMPDCIKATIDLITAPEESLKQRTFNLTAMSFTPKELATEIKKFIPEFECDFSPDFRQKIAENWPQSIDDKEAREQWGWDHEYDITAMTVDMLNVLGEKYETGKNFGTLTQKEEGAKWTV